MSGSSDAVYPVSRQTQANILLASMPALLLASLNFYFLFNLFHLVEVSLLSTYTFIRLISFGGSLASPQFNSHFLFDLFHLVVVSLLSTYTFYLTYSVEVSLLCSPTHTFYSTFISFGGILASPQPSSHFLFNLLGESLVRNIGLQEYSLPDRG